MSDDDVQPPSATAGEPAAGEKSRAAAALTALERWLIADAKKARQLEEGVLPAWLRPTQGEHRWQMGAAVIIAIGLQLSLPGHLTIQPHYVVPIIEGAILVGLFIASPARFVKHSAGLHFTALALIGLISAETAISAALLVHEIVTGTAASAPRLLVQGVAIWLANVIVFGLWYWEFDRGGPVARTHADRKHPDLLFPQMQQPEIASPDWEPTFFDYLYTSFTNATAFSPTDTMPLSRWAKAMFLLQSAISLVTVALVISRAVNIFQDVTQK